MSEQLTRFDPAEYLEDQEDIEAYLDAAMAEAGDDPKFIARVLGDIARSRNMTQLAKEVGITRTGLWKALSPDGNPRLDTLIRVAKALGLKLTIATA